MKMSQSSPHLVSSGTTHEVVWDIFRALFIVLYMLMTSTWKLSCSLLYCYKTSCCMPINDYTMNSIAINKVMDAKVVVFRFRPTPNVMTNDLPFWISKTE